MKTIWIAVRVSCQPVNGMKADSLGVFSAEGDGEAAACDDIKKWGESRGKMKMWKLTLTR